MNHSGYEVFAQAGSEALIVTGIGNTAQEGHPLGVTQISHAMGFHTGYENHVIGSHDPFVYFLIIFLVI
jgi:hypothetical protein